MKPLRRLLNVIIFLLSAVAFSIIIPIQYLFTGRTNIMEIVNKQLDELMDRINPDK